MTGGTASFLELSKRRFARFLRHKKGARLLSDQASEFKRCFSERLNEQDRRTLERFLSVRGNLRDRVTYNAVMDVWRQSWSDTMILRALILMGRV